MYQATLHEDRHSQSFLLRLGTRLTDYLLLLLSFDIVALFLDNYLFLLLAFCLMVWFLCRGLGDGYSRRFVGGF